MATADAEGKLLGDDDRLKMLFDFTLSATAMPWLH
jgi:hypothetical protein